MNFLDPFFIDKNKTHTLPAVVFYLSGGVILVVRKYVIESKWRKVPTYKVLTVKCTSGTNQSKCKQQ